MTWRRVMWISAGLAATSLSLASFGIAVAAYVKSRESAVIRTGFAADYVTLSLFAVVAGIALAAFAAFALTRRPKTPPSSESHF